MYINKTTLQVTLKSDHAVNVGKWTSSMLRGAIKSALAHQHCTSLQYENCNKCRYEDCPNKFLFDRKEIGCGTIQANLVILDAPFYDEDETTDTLDFKVIIFENLCDEVDILRELFTSGIRMGKPRVLWHATQFIEDEEQIDFPEYTPNSDKVSSCVIKFETPVVSNKLLEIKGCKLTPENLVKVMTVRLAGISNMAELGYEVPYKQLIEDSKDFVINKTGLSKIQMCRKSTTKNRIDTVTANIGELKLIGKLDSLHPFLKLISNLNIGKECTMGLGKFSVSELDYGDGSGT